jgi:hypothetical protein
MWISVIARIPFPPGWGMKALHGAVLRCANSPVGCRPAGPYVPPAAHRTQKNCRWGTHGSAAYRYASSSERAGSAWTAALAAPRGGNYAGTWPFYPAQPLHSECIALHRSPQATRITAWVDKCHCRECSCPPDRERLSLHARLRRGAYEPQQNTPVRRSQDKG